MEPDKKKTNWKPSRKWWTQFVASAGTLAGMVWTGDGVNTDDEKLAVIGILVALVGTYWVPNGDNS